MMDIGHDGFGDGSTRGIGFQAATTATAADTSSRVDDGVADLASRPGKAGIHRAILYDARSDTGADKDADEISIALASSIQIFTEGCYLYVVANSHRNVKVVIEDFAQRE